MMYSGGSFGEYAFSEQDYVSLDDPLFAAFLESVTEERCWILELDGFSLAPTLTVSGAYSDAAFSDVAFCDAGASVDAGVQTLRYSTHGYTSHADDTPALTFFDGRLMGDLVIDRQVAGRDGLGGLVALFAEVSLVNRDGALDNICDNYSFEGRTARILVGRPSDPYSLFGLVFSGIFQESSADLSSMRIKLSDGIAKLRCHPNETSFAGTGDLEGGDDLKGKFKPKAFGKCFNVAPPLVDTAKLIYQVNDGEITDVTLVADRGVPLSRGADYTSLSELNTVAPSLGDFRVWKEGGYFRLGSNPDGVVTADVEGDTPVSYAETTGDIVFNILRGTPQLNNSEIDPTSFQRLNSDAPATVGRWVGPEDDLSCADLVDELLSGVGAFGGFARNGAFKVSVLSAASGLEAATYDESHIIDLERETLPASLSPSVWRVAVGWQALYLAQPDVASGVDPDRASFLAAPRRLAVDEDATIRTRSILAREYGPILALYAEEADAVTEAERLFALWGANSSSRKALYKVSLPFVAMTRDLGDVVSLVFPRFGFSEGRDARVIGFRLEGARVDLRVLA